jgi:hypothetical protein
MAMCLDQQNNLWVGEETGDASGGLYRFSAADGLWQRFTTKDGLGDDSIYALACDLQGRLWIGHLNHGISVFNGQKFQNYEVVAGLSKPDTLNGPLGERIFKIAVAPDWSLPAGQAPTFHDSLTDKDSPVAGSVWMASSAGIAIYFPSTDTWSYLTRAEGLPSDQANAIAFAKDGTVFLGHQCDGLSIGSPADHYATWKQVTAAHPTPHPVDGKLVDTPVPTVGQGPGLPTDLINDLLITKDGTVYAATTLGLAWSTDKGNSWQFVRGADWIDKVKNRFGGPSPNWQAPTDPTKGGGILAEDYTTTLAEDPDGNLLVGHRATAGDILAPQAARKLATSDILYITGYVPIAATKNAFRGSYGNGMSVYGIDKKGPTLLSDDAALPKRAVGLPTGAPVPTPSDLEILANRLKDAQRNAPKNSAPVAVMTPDWTTQGAWLGRIGRYWMVHSAAISPYDLYWGIGAANVQYEVRQGTRGIEAGDSLRYWVTTNHTRDQRALELTMPYLQSRVEKGLTTWDVDRRFCSWDDHGEAYPISQQGPDIFLSVRIPEGVFVLSLYNVIDFDRNFDKGNWRDFVISFRDPPKTETPFTIEGFQKWPELARVRAARYFGGVYSRFLVGGPRTVTIEINRNWSFNATLNGAFLDEVDSFPPVYYGDSRGVQPPPAPTESAPKAVAALEDLRSTNLAAFSIVSRQAYATIGRYSMAKPSGQETNLTHGAEQQAAAVAWNLCTYAKSEVMQHELGMRTSRDIEKMLRWDGNTAGLSPHLNFDLVSVSRTTNTSEHTGILIRDRKE